MASANNSLLLYQDYVSPYPPPPTYINASFIEVGSGQCLDVNKDYYDVTWVSGLSPPNQTTETEINAAIDWCLVATEYISSLVGVSIRTNSRNWACFYENGTIDNLQDEYLRNMDPDNIGTGAVANSDGDSDYLCYKNAVSVN
jgi:hypothetical protein